MSKVQTDQVTSLSDLLSFKYNNAKEARKTTLL